MFHHSPMKNYFPYKPVTAFQLFNKTLFIAIELIQGGQPGENYSCFFVATSMIMFDVSEALFLLICVRVQF